MKLHPDDRYLCKAEFPPKRWQKPGQPFQLTAYCTRVRFHWGWHKAGTGDGRVVEKWWRGWEPSPGKGGKPLLTAKERRSRQLLMITSILGCFASSHLANQPGLPRWLHAAGWLAYVICITAWASTLTELKRDMLRHRRYLKEQAEAMTVPLLPGSYYASTPGASFLHTHGLKAEVSGRTYDVPPWNLSVRHDGQTTTYTVTADEHRQQVAELTGLVGRMYDLEECQPKILIRQVTRGA